MCAQAEDEKPNTRVHNDRFLPIAIAEGNARVIHLASSLNFFLGEAQTTCSPLRIIHSRDNAAYKIAAEANSDWSPESDWESRIWIPQLNGYFPKGGLRFPGMWVHDPLISLSMLIRRVNRFLRGLAWFK